MQRFGFIWVVVMAAGFTNSGCYNQQVLRQETFTTNSPYAVLDTPGLASMKRENPPPPSDQAWWYSRYDAPLGVRPADTPADLVYYRIRTIDRQNVSDDRIYDNVQRTTYSERIGVGYQ